MKLFSVAWKSSKKRGKQRKYRRNAPLHLKRAFLVVQLSDELAGRYGMKRAGVRTGDTVRVVKGEFRGVAGKVNSVDLKDGVVYVDGAARVRKDGTKSFFPLMASSLLLTEIATEDKRRMQVFARKSSGVKK